LFQSWVTSNCFIVFRPLVQMLINVLMFNYFRQPPFS
jgi:hypothetical protein